MRISTSRGAVLEAGGGALRRPILVAVPAAADVLGGEGAQHAHGRER
jgi:hypothetical protein